jgi:hypothetical protein
LLEVWPAYILKFPINLASVLIVLESDRQGPVIFRFDFFPFFTPRFLLANFRLGGSIALQAGVGVKKVRTGISPNTLGSLA